MKKTRAFFYSRKIPITVILGIIAFHSKAQQGPQFTQFMYNNLVINPAYAGAEEAFSFTMVSRNQWSGIENAPSTQSFSAHTLMKKKTRWVRTYYYPRSTRGYIKTPMF